MTDPIQTITSLIQRLDFTPVGDGQTAYGAFGDTPVTLTVLTLEPLGLLFAFNVNCDHGDLCFLDSLPAEWTSEVCKASLENGRAWLPLYDLNGRTEDEIVSLLERFHEGLVQANVAVGPGCVRCGCLSEATVMYVEGRTTRICLNCLAQAIADKQERESQFNRMSLSALLALPAAISIAAGCWTLFWLGIDFVVDWFRIRVIEINQFTVALLMVLFVGTGAALGMPLGRMLRRSGAIRPAPIPLAFSVAVCAVIAGELGYVTLLLFWNFGVWNLGAALQAIGPVITSYSGFWITSKVLCTLAISSFCVATASERNAVSLKI